MSISDRNTLPKFSGPDAAASEEFAYPDLYEREERDGWSRLRIGARSREIPLILALCKRCSGPFGILYVLVTSRCDHEEARYESPQPVEFDELERFLLRFRDFFEQDGRHNLWIMSLEDGAQFVFDKHNIVYAYGDLDRFERGLISGQFRNAPVDIPYPHVHYYHDRFDTEENAVFDYWDWIQYPLEGVDDDREREPDDNRTLANQIEGYKRLLETCRRNFGEAPREFSLWERTTYLKVPRPAWLGPFSRDDLKLLIRNARNLYRDGVIVWGHVVQANELMFEDGNDNCPGEVVYSLDDSDRVPPMLLGEVASRIFQLKNTQPSDARLRHIADHLTNELTRVFGLSVPSSLSPFFRCRLSTTLFVRQHLPNRRLCAPYFPLIVNPVEPHVVLPLPERYWPESLRDFWVQ